MNETFDTLQDPRTAKERAEPCGNCGHSRGNHRFHAVGGKRPCYDGDAAESCRCKAFVQRTQATFSAGQRFRIMGASSAYGTVVVRPHGEGQRIGIPVIMDGDRFVTYRAVYEMEAING